MSSRTSRTTPSATTPTPSLHCSRCAFPSTSLDDLPTDRAWPFMTFRSTFSLNLPSASIHTFSLATNWPSVRQPIAGALLPCRPLHPPARARPPAQRGAEGGRRLARRCRSDRDARRAAIAGRSVAGRAAAHVGRRPARRRPRRRLCLARIARLDAHDAARWRGRLARQVDALDPEARGRRATRVDGRARVHPPPGQPQEPGRRLGRRLAQVGPRARRPRRGRRRRRRCRATPRAHEPRGGGRTRLNHPAHRAQLVCQVQLDADERGGRRRRGRGRRRRRRRRPPSGRARRGAGGLPTHAHVRRTHERDGAGAAAVGGARRDASPLDG